MAGRNQLVVHLHLCAVHAMGIPALWRLLAESGLVTELTGANHKAIADRLTSVPITCAVDASIWIAEANQVRCGRFNIATSVRTESFALFADACGRSYYARAIPCSSIGVQPGMWLQVPAPGQPCCAQAVKNSRRFRTFCVTASRQYACSTERQTQTRSTPSAGGQHCFCHATQHAWHGTPCSCVMHNCRTQQLKKA